MLREYVSSGMKPYDQVMHLQYHWLIRPMVFPTRFFVVFLVLESYQCVVQWSKEKTFGCWVIVDHDNASLRKTSLI